jgi:protein TonB
VPILAAALPLALPSAAPSAGLADGDDSRRGGGLAGIGPGAGGSGAGLGGNGGRGADRGDGSPPVRIRGELKNSDYPKEARKAGQQGRVETEITVDPKGRPSACAVTRSSGSAELDRATCRLIMHRFRYAPARDRSGRRLRASPPTTSTGCTDRPAASEQAGKSRPPVSGQSRAALVVYPLLTIFGDHSVFHREDPS